MDDGVLHTVLVKNISRVKFAGLFSAYSAGRYRSLPPEVIRVVTAKNVRIQSEDDIVTCLDGETIHSRDVRLTLSEKRLNFFGPKGCDPNYGAGPKGGREPTIFPNGNFITYLQITPLQTGTVVL